jgi:rod shape-determining protein MreC
LRNIFLFVRRYAVLLFFLLLQGFSIYLIVQYNKHHHAVFSSTANNVTGKVNTQFNKVEDYFYLKKTNDSLLKANERLYNKLRQNFQLPDTISRIVIDTLKIDSLEEHRMYTYLQATVIANAVNTQSNYIVLGRGKNQQLKEGMGIIDINNGVVGIITSLNNNNAVAMSLMHKDSHISGKLLNGGETGTLNWDGKTPNIVSLTGIPKSAKVAKGDTIITSGYSTTFAKGLLIGFVTDLIPEKSSNNYLIKLKTAADFYNLQYVYVIDNKQQEAVKELLDKATQQNK